MVHQGVGDWQFSGVYWSTFDADEWKRLRFQLTCTWTCSKMVNETESLQVRIEEKHRAGHWLSCPFHAKSDIWYTCWYRYITAIEISLTSGFSLIIIMVHSSSSLHLHCPPCSLTTVSLFVIFYWKLCIIHFPVTVYALKISAWFHFPPWKSFLFPELVDTEKQIKELLISHYGAING